MGEKAKLDVIDLVIKVLREHEHSLDQLIERLETLVQSMHEILSENGDLGAIAGVDENEALANRIRELERQIQAYRGSEIAMIDALSSLYSIEQTTEVSATV